MRWSSSYARALVTNLILVALVALLLLPLGFRMADIVREQEMSDRRHTLANGLNDLENQIMNIHNILMQTSSLRIFTRLSLIRQTLYPSDYLYMQRCQELLLAIASSNGAVLDILLTFDENDLMITKHYAFENMNGFLKQYQLEGLDSGIFHSPSTPSEASFLPEARLSSGYLTESRAGLCYRLPLKFNAYAPLQAVAYVFIRQEYIQSMLLSNSLRTHGALTLSDAKGQTLTTYTGASYETRYGTDLLQLQSNKRLLRAQASLDRRYGRTLLSGIYAFIGLSIGFAVFAGILGSIGAAYRQSLPIRRLLEELERQGLSGRMRASDYEQLKEGLLRAASERQDFVAQINATRQTLHSHLLDYLLYNSVFNPAQEREYRRLLPDLPERFCVGYGSFQDPGGSPQDRSILFAFLLDQLKKELPGSEARMQMESGFALILPWSERIEQQVCKAVQSLGQASQPCIALSAPLTCLHQINMGFEQAKLRYAHRQPNQCLLLGPEQDGEPSETDDFQDIQSLHRALVCGNIAVAGPIQKQLLYRDTLPQADFEQRYYLLRMQLLMIQRQTGCADVVLHLPKYQANMRPENVLRILDRAA
ncbi:MAG TPA: hypothetical protein PKE04_16560 [Clostridia bacterium]|nr:hypothetical protein [Clostridia bacterium]